MVGRHGCLVCFVRCLSVNLAFGSMFDREVEEARGVSGLVW